MTTAPFTWVLVHSMRDSTFIELRQTTTESVIFPLVGTNGG